MGRAACASQVKEQMPEEYYEIFGHPPMRQSLSELLGRRRGSSLEHIYRGGAAAAPRKRRGSFYF